MNAPTTNSQGNKVLEMPVDEARITEASASVAAADEQIFRLQVQLDLQGERQLLYKVVFVLLVIGALLIAREWAIWLLG